VRRNRDSLLYFFIQRMPKIFRPMITTSGTPQSQRMMLFMIGVSVE
jgi:hypothetical protein